MNFYINKKNLTKNGGPYNFAKILEHELINRFGAKKKFLFPEINIIFSSGRNFRYSKNILRVDGIFVQNMDKRKKKINQNIFKSIIKADGVIFQSKFSRKLILHYFKKKYNFNTRLIKNIVIPNAFSTNYFIKKKINYFKYKHVLLTITRKSKNKRLKQIIDAFKLLDKKKYLLIVIGDYFKEDFVKQKNIKFVGKIENEKIPFYIKRSDALIHVSKIESCSNAVIECLSSGLPVITNNVGGTKELIKDNGIILGLDKKEVFSEKYFSDFRCNKFILADGIKEVVKIKRKKNEIYSPKNIVKRYYSFFKTIMND